MAANQYVYTIYPGGILRMFGFSNSWEKIGGPGKSFACNNQGAFGVGGGSDHVFQVISTSNAPDIRNRPTTTIVARGNMLCAVDEPSPHNIFQHVASNQWTQIGGPGKMFAIDDQGRLYGLTPDGSKVFHFNGPGVPWTPIGDAAGQIFAGGSVLCATTTDNLRLFCFRDESQ